MLDRLKDFFNTNLNDKSIVNNERERHLKISACAILLEIADADDLITKEEQKRIIDLMKEKFSLNDNEVSELIKQTQKERDNSVSIYEFTDILNKNLNENEKYQIVKNLWEIAYADGELDKYEDYYIKKISNNLNLHHKDRIAAKLEVKKELGI